MRRPFVLLEVLVSLTLVAICSSVFIKNALFYSTSSLKPLIELELERVAEERYALILEKIYKKELKWKNLNDRQGKIQGHTKEKDPIYITFDKNHRYEYSLEYYFEKKGRLESDKFIHRHLDLHLIYSPKLKKLPSVERVYKVIAKGPKGSADSK